MKDQYKTRFTLIQRIQTESRDDKTWEDFVASYENYIYVIIRSFKLSPALCQDLLQNVLLQLWKDLPKFEYRPNKCRFRTWLSVVTKNVVRTYLKSKAGRNEKQNIEYSSALHSVDNISDAEIEQIADKEWKIFILEKALDNLKSSISEKIMIALQDSFDNIPTRTTAEKLSTTEASVRVYRQRGTNALKKEVLRLNTELDM
ncbi:probable ECF sigma factor [Lentisphaera araneosa HTCC2155]|uniref:Probable ECF sigma factor n=1 Tax=Lentisphaera araneosa HTCC2155 TaxID=313628 RepID=A6DM11_9BACT|nr:sigma-70 family RNA polymerase sigma factor [Lentisphaera araneosa]EDM27309.1 probable ECF sigma factor [Lentisphaera araneosa HTCC2155]